MKFKKLMAVGMSAAMMLSMAACSGSSSSSQSYNVGVVQLVQHPALDAATEGFQDALKEALGEENVKIDVQNASGDSANCATIVNGFVTDKVDLIMANATPALQAATAATSDIPVLGTSITDYGTALGLTDYDGKVVGGNVSGTSDLAPLDEQAASIKELFPDAKKVGILYCSAEPNSKFQSEMITKYLSDLGIEATEFTFTDSNDITGVTQTACEKSDVIYIPTDNTAANAANTIWNVVSDAKYLTPVFAGEEGIASGCGVATLSISYYDLGYTTGQMAAKILKDGEDISTMEIQYAPVSKKCAKEHADLYGLTIPEDYEEIVTE